MRGLFCAALAALACATLAHAQQQDQPLVGKAAFGDWHDDGPGVWRLIRPGDLPRPSAAESASNGADAIAAPDNAALAGVSDDRILSAMAERVFSAGFVWSVIEQKWPGFEAAFLGFEPKRLLFQPDDFWHELASDKRIVRNPQKIRAAFRKFVEERLPADCSVEFHPHGGSPAIQLSYDSPFLTKARTALSEEWPKPAVVLGSGGSIPVVGDFQSFLGMGSLLVGFALSDDCVHSPNEKYDLRSFHKGQRSWARILDALTR